jgi:hypothetical protein
MPPEATPQIYEHSPLHDGVPDTADGPTRLCTVNSIFAVFPCLQRPVFGTESLHPMEDEQRADQERILAASIAIVNANAAVRRLYCVIQIREQQ